MRQFFLFILIFLSISVFGQNVRKSFEGIYFSPQYFDSLQKGHNNTKKLPAGYENQTLQSLTYFPELKNVKITFKIKKKDSPLMVRPTVGSCIFRSAPKRTYIIFISSHSAHQDSILMKNLSQDAQIGVIGHELSHVSYFIKQNRLQMVRLAFGNLSWKYLDRIEFETDRATVNRGLGYQLLAWSEFVRLKLKMDKWEGTDLYIYGKTDRPKDRYMNPETIKATMAECALYYR